MTAASKPAAPEAAQIQARELTRGNDQAHIVLNGQVYFLRITRAGTLIPTK